MLVATWNVNGIRSVARKDLLPWDLLADADVICLQETKAHPGQLPPELREPAGYHTHWVSAVKKGYSGAAILSRDKPDEVVEGLGKKRFDDEGRVLAARFGEVVVISAYFPNSQEAGARLSYKLGFCRAMEAYLRDWTDRGYHTLLTGDYNIAHEPIDLARPKQNEKNPGYLPEERAWMSRYLRLGYHDVFRERNPELEGAYSWWSFRSNARERNVGWRIDYATVSSGLLDAVTDARIHPEIQGSDHCPVSVTLG